MKEKGEPPLGRTRSVGDEITIHLQSPLPFLWGRCWALRATCSGIESTRLYTGEILKDFGRANTTKKIGFVWGNAVLGGLGASKVF